MRLLNKAITALTVSLSLVSFNASAGWFSDDEVPEDFKTVKVGVVGEYNEQWNTVNDLLKDDKIYVKLVKFTDYATPNRALNDGEIDLNAFQHYAFLENDIKQNGYKIVPLGKTLIAPIRLYNNKSKISKVEDIKDGDIVAIPSDLTNGGRAIKLLEQAGLIEVDPKVGYLPTKADITKYNKNIEIREAESGVLANILPDVSAAIINGGNAYTAGLKPEDSILTEQVVDSNPYINVIVSREADKDNEIYKKIVEKYQTPEVKKTIIDAYNNSFIPAF